MDTTRLSVEGMVCDACAGHVTKSLKSVPGVKTVKVDRAAGKARIEHDSASVSALLSAVEEAGYQGQVESGGS